MMKFVFLLYLSLILILCKNNAHEEKITINLKQDDLDLNRYKDELSRIEGFFAHLHLEQLNEMRFQQVEEDDSFQLRNKEVQPPQEVAMTGPQGNPCYGKQDCMQKNREFYTTIKNRLKGDDGANGEKGPKGQRGPQGPKGKQGPKGADGIAFTKDFLFDLAKEVAQNEIMRSTQDQIENLATFNTEALLEQVYYGNGQENCVDQRKAYIMECDADISEYCQETTLNDCCKSVDCYKALDQLVCCFQSKKAPIEQVQKWDTNVGSTWMDVMKVINERQNQLQKVQENAVVKPIFDRFHLRNEQCAKDNWDYKLQCPLPSKQPKNNVAESKSQDE